MRLEAVVIPVPDVDRALDFYKALGWRLDAGLTTAGPGSTQDPDGNEWFVKEITTRLPGR
jgi:catechol 2,3-dioxygenase-like lactoylglutathione lyase family enzyme